MSKSRLFFFFCLSFLGGVGLASFFHFSLVALFAFSIFALILIGPLWRRKNIVFVGFSLLFVILGIWRCQIAQERIVQSVLRQLSDKKERVSFVGEIVREPDVRDKSTKLTVRTNKGKVLVTARNGSSFRYGDKISLDGVLKTPPVFQDFNYRGYLAKEGIAAVMAYPKISLLSRNNGSPIYSGLLYLKNKLREVIYQNLSPPNSFILGAVILGDKSRISPLWKQKLNKAGVRHLTAISGMHIVILSNILMALGLAIGLWRRQSFYFSLILLTFYILMIGAPASAIRAGIMVGLLLFAQAVGRASQSQRAIVMAAALMLLINPLLLKFDVGFQLSFLAVLGIIYFGPSFKKWLSKLPNFLGAREILAITFSAQIFTLPILIYNFGYFSLVSPLTNIFIVPVLPLIMILGFVFTLVGIIMPWLGWLFSLPCQLFLIYITSVISFFSRLPLASLSLKLSLSWMVVLYAFLIWFAFRLRKKQPFFLDYEPL